MADPVWVAICVPGAKATSGPTPCVTGDGQTGVLKTVQAYLSTPSGEPFPLSVEDVACVWSVGFSTVVMCFVIARCLGTLVDFIRR